MNIRNAVITVGVAAAAALFISTYIEGLIVERNAALLAIDSLEAVNDTTRLRIVETLQGEIRIWERRAVQSENVADSLDEQLQRQTVARVRAEGRIDELETQVHGIVFDQAEPGQDTLHGAEFNVRQPPYTVWARAVLSDPPILRLRIQLDTIPLTLRLSCGLQEDGVRRAYASLEAPEWAEVEVTEAVQEPDLCNPGLATEPSFWGKHGGKIVVGAGVLGSVWAVKTLYEIASDLF